MHISEDNINFLLIVAAFVLNAIVKKLRQWWAKTKLFSKSQINHDLKNQIEINSKLEVLRTRLNANRVAIINYDPYSQSATMVYERVKEGTSELMPMFRGVQTSSIAPLLYELEENSFVEMHSNYHDRKVVELHKAWGIASTIKFKLDKHKSIAHGCIVLAFDSDKFLNSDELEFIKSSIYTINQLYAK